ncbi:MAG: protein kinase [Polyangiaceae bacterium]|nr:protein kinase [Polyangiaceae bacterium]
MRPRDLVGDRFRVLGRAGAGGMGVVYRAEDLSTGEHCALKVLHADQKPDRFLREAAVLAELSHPAVVRYIAHGITPRGEVYLAMEWLEATSLASYIASRRLGFGECLALLRRVCAGLAVAHRLGVVHRDLKPGNILIPDGVLGNAKLIDFGIARRRFDPRITERGLLIGTLAYMSPEQARGSAHIEPASDVFSLGSVVYKCMTGDTPFGGGDSTAVLAKVLLDEPTPLRELSVAVPEAFDDLVSRMLAKAPEARPRDAGALLGQCDALGTATAETHAVPGITGREQRVVWVALLGGLPADDGETRQETEPQIARAPESRLADAVVASGGRFDTLANGARMASFVGGGAPRDEALRAVRVARTMHQLFPDRAVALASGLGVVGGRAPVGEAIEHGVALLARTAPGQVALDESTAGLIASAYELERDSRGAALLGSKSTADGVRRLLGRPTTMVGRERELFMLEELVDECLHEPVPRAALVIAPAGVGKSRLRYELLARLRARHPAAEVLFGRAEGVSAGSPFALLRGALRTSAGLCDGEGIDQSRAKLTARVAKHPLAGSDVERTTVFLGELADVSFPDGAHPSLLAMRQNPTLLGDAMRGAFLDFMAGECAAHPVVVVLEDLHWGDLPSVNLVEAALFTLAEAPLFVLGLGRPEVADVLPNLWQKREPLEIRLGPLRKSAALSLAHEVLGEGADAARLERAVDLADGNAFFLEELLRSLAEGQRDLPETVLGMVQSRLEALGPEPRRILRAASIFGAHFWTGGVQAVLGGDAEETFVSIELDELNRRELISASARSSFAGEAEHVFRNGTLREAVYSTLTPEDRALGHRLAGAWLEEAGLTDALALAEHFRHGELPERAARYYLAAAREALEGNDLEALLVRVDRALEMAPDETTRGELHYLAADARFWRGEYTEAERHARAAVDLLAPGSARWYVSIGALCSAVGTLGRDQELIAWGARAAAQVAVGEEARANQVVALIRASHGHLKLGLNDAADTLIATASDLSGELDALAALGRAWVHHGKSARAYYAGDVSRFMSEVEASIAAFDAIGDVRTGTNARANLGYAALSAGDIDRALRLLEEALALTERFGMAGIGHYVMHNLGLALAYRGQFERAVEMERRAMVEAETRQETLLMSATHLYLALILLMSGDPAGAEAEAKIAFAAAPTVPIVRAQALAAESAALLAQGRVEPALAQARAGLGLLEEHGGSDETEGRVRAAFVEAARASGHVDLAREAAAIAVERLRKRADSFRDDRLSRCFLQNVPEHARLVVLAAELGVG